MKQKKASKSETKDVCLECDWCRSAPILGAGEDYVCLKRSRPLDHKMLWGPTCRHFRPID